MGKIHICVNKESAARIECLPPCPENQIITEKRAILFGTSAPIFFYLGFFAGLDLFSLSYIAEGFPLPVGEAMASGLPCAVTDVGDTGFVSWRDRHSGSRTESKIIG